MVRIPLRPRLAENWRPSPEDRAFALRHGMNPNAVAHALRDCRQTDSAAWCAWVECRAIEAPVRP
jgi:hypothetical protein